MSCQDVSFLGGRFRVEVERDPTWPFGDRYKAIVSAIDGDLHPPPAERALIFPDGARMVFYGETDAHAVNQAVAFLTERFGGFSETPVTCDAPGGGTTPGRPLVVDPEPPVT
jgi:hypothetical protein